MSHDYHEKLYGFHPDQVLIDGCSECEARSRRDDGGISTLDSENFTRALRRAQQWERHGLPTLSNAERPMLTILSSVCAQMGRLSTSPLWQVAS